MNSSSRVALGVSFPFVFSLGKSLLRLDRSLQLIQFVLVHRLQLPQLWCGVLFAT
jgi:hypothetical protein